LRAVAINAIIAFDYHTTLFLIYTGDLNIAMKIRLCYFDCDLRDLFFQFQSAGCVYEK